MKYAFVTGSTRGIGLSIARKILLDQEYNLLVHGKRDLKSEELEHLFGSENIGRITYLKADFSNPEEISKLDLDYAELDLFVNNAGVYQSDSISDLININLTSSILLVDKVYSTIGKNKGLIININSLAGLYPNFKESVYCASKFGLDGYFKSLQSECHKDGVTISQYYLGATKTDMTRHRSDFDLLIDPDELADLIYFSMKCKSLIPAGQTIKRKKY
jgi:3-oxoacyl-[acyl-carrier protein] reductase